MRRNLGKPLRKRRRGMGIDLPADAQKVGARFVDEQLSSHERRLPKPQRLFLVGWWTPPHGDHRRIVFGAARCRDGVNDVVK